MKYLKKYIESNRKIEKKETLYLSSENIEEIKFLFREFADEYNLFRYDDNGFDIDRKFNYYIFFFMDEKIEYTYEDNNIFYISAYIHLVSFHNKKEVVSDINNLVNRLRSMDFKVYTPKTEVDDQEIYYNIQIFKYDHNLYKDPAGSQYIYHE